MMDDLISREDAIALVIKAIHGTDNKEIQEYLFDGLRKQMWSLPSADRPTQLKGGTLMIAVEDVDVIKRVIVENRPWCKVFYEE